MPTPEQYQEWAAIADGVLAGKPLSEASEAQKLAVMAIRSAGPDAAQQLLKDNGFFSQADSPTTLDYATGKQIPIADLPPVARDYMLRVRQQQQQDALATSVILS